MRYPKTIVALTVAASVLSACGAGSDAIPSVSPDTATHVAMNSDKFATLQHTIFTSVEAADGALDSAALADRTVGPFQQIRAAQYAVKKVMGDSYTLSALSTSVAGTAVSSSNESARLALSVMEAASGQNLQTIDVFAQTNARDNWKLWGVLSVLPGATIPAISSGDSGAEVIVSDSGDGLVASPKDVLGAYLKLNQTRTDSGGLGIKDDYVMQAIADVQDSNAKAVDGVGRSTMSFSLGSDGPVSFRTEDGGAVVIGQLNYTSTLTVDAGRTVDVSTLAGKVASGKADGVTSLDGKSLVAENTMLVAMYVPASTASDKTIRVVGASDAALLKVSVK